MRETFTRKGTRESSSRVPSRLYCPAENTFQNYLTFLSWTIIVPHHPESCPFVWKYFRPLCALKSFRACSPSHIPNHTVFDGNVNLFFNFHKTCWVFPAAVSLVHTILLSCHIPKPNFGTISPCGKRQLDKFIQHKQYKHPFHRKMQYKRSYPAHQNGSYPQGAPF